jgi:hypothetical protein
MTVGFRGLLFYDQYPSVEMKRSLEYIVIDQLLGGFERSCTTEGFVSVCTIGGSLSTLSWK